jgi:hypothetical protein
VSQSNKNRYNGESNPFYGKKHTDESKEKISKHNKKYYKTHDNPFKGKRHSVESKKKIGEKSRARCGGSGNPFYGKKHKQETIEQIQYKNFLYRQNNKKRILNRRLELMHKTQEDFQKMLYEYKNSHTTLSSLREKHQIDKRTITSYWIKLDLINHDELRELTAYKQLNANPSKPEFDLFSSLKRIYGEINVKSNYKLNNFYYDICLYNKILIEYDGYYWHEILKNSNDVIKNSLARENNFILCRIKESHRMSNVDIKAVLIPLQDFINRYLKGEFDTRSLLSPQVFSLQNN